MSSPVHLVFELQCEGTSNFSPSSALTHVNSRPKKKNVLDRCAGIHAFLATLVALHFTPVSESVGDSFELGSSPRTSVAWSLRACLRRDHQQCWSSLVIVPHPLHIFKKPDFCLHIGRIAPLLIHVNAEF